MGRSPNQKRFSSENSCPFETDLKEFLLRKSVLNINIFYLGKSGLWPSIKTNSANLAHQCKSLLTLALNIGCPKSFGHILTLDISKTVKDIATHLIYCESLQSQVYDAMFKDVQCEHDRPHGPHQGESPIFAERIQALRLAEPYHVKLRGGPLAGHKHSSFMNLPCHLNMDFLSGASFRNFVRNTR